MKNVLHIVHTSKMSGAEKVALLLCKNVKSTNNYIVCGGSPLKDIYAGNNIKAYAIDYKKSILNTIRELNNIVKTNEIDIIHAHDNRASIYSLILKRIYRYRKIKIVSHIHNSYPWLAKKININKFIDRITRNKYDFNICCGDTVLKYYLENTKYISNEKIKSIPNCLDTNTVTISEDEEIREFKKCNDIPEDKFVFGFIGRITKQKGLIPFVHKLAEKSEVFKDSCFLIVGVGEQEEELKSLIKNYGIEELFIFAGYKNETKNFYKVIDCFFLPSLYEGLPMVLLEAMSYKRAIISMNVGSIAEVINNRTGVLITKGNYNKFVEELIKIKGEYERISELGKNAHRYIKENYDISIQAKQVEDLYNKLSKEV